MRRLTCGVVLILAVFVYVNAEVPPSDKGSAIQEMFQLIGMDQQMKEGFEAMLPFVDQLASRFQLNEAEKEELKTIYRDWFENDIDHKGINEKIAKLYADTFTLEEINELIKFYRTPVGQKFLKKSPELMKLSAQIGMKEAQAKQSKLLERLQPFLEKHQQKSNKGNKADH